MRIHNAAREVPDVVYLRELREAVPVGKRRTEEQDEKQQGREGISLTEMLGGVPEEKEMKKEDYTELMKKKGFHFRKQETLYPHEWVMQVIDNLTFMEVLKVGFGLVIIYICILILTLMATPLMDLDTTKMEMAQINTPVTGCGIVPIAPLVLFVIALFFALYLWATRD